MQRTIRASFASELDLILESEGRDFFTMIEMCER